MPIVVRELVIRARVGEVGGNGRVAGSLRPPADAAGMREAEIQRIVALCVEQVMDNIDRAKER